MVNRAAAAWAAIGCVLGAVSLAWGQGVTRAEEPATTAASAPASGLKVLDLDRRWLMEGREHGLNIEGLALPDASMVDLVLEPFSIVAADATITVVDARGERAADFDPASIRFWRGSVRGVHGSHVFLGVAEGSVIGRIELGAGRPTYVISSRGGDPTSGGVELAKDQVVVYEASARTPAPLAPVLCGTGLHASIGMVPIGPAGEAPPQKDGPDSPGLSPFAAGIAPGMRRARLAVDSDYEFFELFGDERAALTYLVQTYAQVSDFTIRDVRVRLDLVYLRLWTTPDDPYGIGASFPDLRDAPAFQIGQLMSGSKFASAGGAAFVCRDLSWVAYATADMGDPTRPFALSQDTRIAAHEIGHNLGSRHPHDYLVDRCDDPTSRPRRGTLISYCAQTFSGGTSLTDPHFHTRCRQAIFECRLRGLVNDCNQNGVDDADDIASGASLDLNDNGIPDECEDCNQNGILDSVDIASGASLDLNMNGIPDECEPDCNANGVPDDLDISSMTSVDANGDGIPDECQADMDANGVFDWVDIFEDMSLDIDRDGVLDAVQDCDGDGVPDIIALDHAHNIWAVSSGDARIKEYHYRSGVLREQSAEGELIDPVDVLVTLDRRVLVSDAGDGTSGGRVVEYDREGVLVRELVAAGSGGLLYPSALCIGPDGSLLVADRDANSVLRYDIDTGDFLGVFVEAMSGGLMAPYGLTIGPNGNLFVSTDHAGVIEYDGATGAHVRQFIEHGAGELHHGRGILFIARPAHLGVGWRCLVASGQNHNILEFDADTGAYVGVFNEGDFRGKLRNPWGLRQGPTGNVYVSSARLHARTAPPPAGALSTDRAGLHLTNPHIFQYDGVSGKLISAYVQALDSGLDHPKGFAFMPGPLDQNANAIPDACETACIADCDGSGTIDLIDFLCFQNAFDAGDPKADCNADGRLDVFDFLCFLTAFDAGCP